MTKIKHRLNLALHFLLASTLILKGFDKFHHHNILGGLMLLFGVIVLVYFVYMVIKNKHSRVMHILIHLFEALVSVFIAYIFFEEGKRFIQYGFVVAAIGFSIAAYLSFKKKV